MCKYMWHTNNYEGGQPSAFMEHVVNINFNMVTQNDALDYIIPFEIFGWVAASLGILFAVSMLFSGLRPSINLHLPLASWEGATLNLKPEGHADLTASFSSPPHVKKREAGHVVFRPDNEEASFLCFR